MYYINTYGISILSILFSLWISYYYSNRGRLSYQYRTTEVVTRNSNIPSDLKFLYKGKEIQKLNKTYLVLWNSGNKEIRKLDIIKLKFNFEDGQIYHKDIVKTSNDSNKFILNYSTNSIECSFDYLNHKDGVTIEILHDCNFSTPKIEAALIGSKIKNEGLLGSGKFSRITNLAGAIIVFIMLTNLVIEYIKISSQPSIEQSFKIVSIIVLTFILYRILKTTEGSIKFPKNLLTANMQI